MVESSTWGEFIECSKGAVTGMLTKYLESKIYCNESVELDNSTCEYIPQQTLT